MVHRDLRQQERPGLGRRVLLLAFSTPSSLRTCWTSLMSLSSVLQVLSRELKNILHMSYIPMLPNKNQ